MNLRLGWSTVDRAWEAALHVDNLFDEEFLIDAGNIGADFGLPTYIRGEPRLVRLDLTRRF